MTTLTREDVGRLRELLGKATPGPWSVCEEPANDYWYAGRSIHSGEPGGIRIADTFNLNSRHKRDAQIIAAAVNSLPALLDLAERYLGAAEWRIDECCGHVTIEPAGEWDAESNAAAAALIGKTVRIVAATVEGESP